MSGLASPPRAMPGYVVAVPVDRESPQPPAPKAHALDAGALFFAVGGGSSRNSELAAAIVVELGWAEEQTSDTYLLGSPKFGVGARILYAPYTQFGSIAEYEGFVFVPLQAVIAWEPAS